MQRRLQALADVLRKNPYIETMAISYGSSFSSSVANNATFYMSLKTPANGRKTFADKLLARLRPQLAKVTRINLYIQSNQDLSLGTRTSRTQCQHTLTGQDLNDLNRWAPIVLGLLYESYIHPLTILSTLPSAGLGAWTTTDPWHWHRR